MYKFFVTGIDTNVGKTVVSAILVEALKADYWKPIQSGSIEGCDSDFIREYTTNAGKIYKEVYALKEPVSPHLAAKYDNKIIDLQSIKIKNENNNLIVEGAGGVLVPLSTNILIIDLIKSLQLPVIVVSKNYLGSINHTLLTIQVLKQYNIPISGIIFNGTPNIDSEEYILKYSQVRLLGKVPVTDKMSKEFIIEQSMQLRKNLYLFNN